MRFGAKPVRIQPEAPPLWQRPLTFAYPGSIFLRVGLAASKPCDSSAFPFELALCAAEAARTWPEWRTDMEGHTWAQMRLAAAIAAFSALPVSVHVDSPAVIRGRVREAE